MSVISIADNLYLIPLDQAIRGFSGFVGAWLYKGQGTTILVDVGPSSTVPALVRSLAQLSVERLDCVLLTHIHIDHAGGIGHLTKAFPLAPIVCHGSAMKHLADPSKLWEGSRKTLGEMALAYGPIEPVPMERLRDSAHFDSWGIRSVATPGHAQHHVSYLLDNILFAGEAGGVCTVTSRDQVLLRPATPPRFIYETSLGSVNRLLDTPHDLLCYGHFGATRDSVRRLSNHGRQLALWLATIRGIMAEVPGRFGVEEGEAWLVEAAFDRLLSADPLLAAWQNLSDDVKSREAYFMRNSIRGFAGYLRDGRNG